MVTGSLLPKTCTDSLSGVPLVLPMEPRPLPSEWGRFRFISNSSTDPPIAERSLGNSTVAAPDVIHFSESDDADERSGLLKVPLSL